MQISIHEPGQSREPCSVPVYLADMSGDLELPSHIAMLTHYPLCSYVAFQDIAGTSSLDMTFTGGPYACTFTPLRNSFHNVRR